MTTKDKQTALLTEILEQLKNLNAAIAPVAQFHVEQIEAHKKTGAELEAAIEKAKANLLAAKKLFDSIPKDTMAELGLEFGKGDFTQPWFTLTQKLKARFVSCSRR